MLAQTRIAEEWERADAAPLVNLWLMPDGDRPDWSREEWVAAFRAQGYRSDSYPSTPRQKPILFRGATFENRTGLSWTTNYALAEWFAKLRGGQVWCVYDVPAAALLARIGPTYADRQAGEAVEFVLDVRDQKVCLF